MRKACTIINAVISAIILLLALVFIVLEGRLLFSGDWLVYDNVIGGFFKYFLRFALALFAASYAILDFVNLKKKSKTILNYLFIGNISLIIMCVVLIFTATNLVGQIGGIIITLQLPFRFFSDYSKYSEIVEN